MKDDMLIIKTADEIECLTGKKPVFKMTNTSLKNITDGILTNSLFGYDVILNDTFDKNSIGLVVDNKVVKIIKLNE